MKALSSLNLSVPRLLPGQGGLVSELQRRDAIGRGGERRKIRIWLILIPIRDRIETIGTIVGVAVLHRVFEIALKRDRVIGMPPIQAIAAAGEFRTGDEGSPVIQVSECDGAVPSAEIPSAVEIILRARADDGGLALIVDEDHVVTFAHPVVMILQN